jgi:hypothetical protein
MMCKLNSIMVSENLEIRLLRQRAQASYLADPPGSQVSGALLFSWNAIKLPLSEERNAHDG